VGPSAAARADGGPTVFVEPSINVPQALPEFVKAYSGELAELVTGGYPHSAVATPDRTTTKVVSQFSATKL